MKEGGIAMQMKGVFVGVALSTLTLQAASVDRILVRQQWPWNEKVNIDFVLTGVTEKMEIDCAVYRGATRLDVPIAAFSGEVCNLSKDGVYRIMFDPSYLAERPAGGKEELRFVLTPSEMAADSRWGEVLYKIFDLEDKTVTDVTRADLLNGIYGSVETAYGKIGEGYSTSLDRDDVLIWTGVTNNIEYKTTKIVFRKIPAGKVCAYNSWSSRVTVPNVDMSEYWIAVFEMTKAQFALLNYSNSTYYAPSFTADQTTPVETIMISRALFNYGGTVDHRKVSGAAVATLRAKFGGEYEFTLPTQAQWQKAYRAGTSTYYYDGLDGQPNTTSNARMDVLGRYKSNGGLVDNGDGTVTTNGVVSVGRYRPNAYGLYDMLGNVMECCLDKNWTIPSTAEGEKDPINPDGIALSHWGQRGGSWADNAAAAPFSVMTRQFSGATQKYIDVGFRLSFWTVPQYSEY